MMKILKGLRVSDPLPVHKKALKSQDLRAFAISVIPGMTKLSIFSSR